MSGSAFMSIKINVLRQGNLQLIAWARSNPVDLQLSIKDLLGIEMPSIPFSFNSGPFKLHYKRRALDAYMVHWLLQLGLA